MWLFARDGFYSIVEKPWDRALGTLTVRARRRDDLERLAEYWTGLEGPGILGREGSKSDIIESRTSDYPFRMRVRKDDMAAVAAKLIFDIDYDNFKNTQPERHEVYFDVWSVMRRLEVGLFGKKAAKKKAQQTLPYD